MNNSNGSDADSYITNDIGEEGAEQGEEDMLTLALITIRFVWDRFELYLDVGMAYEQLMDCQHALLVMFHALNS